MYIHEQLDWPRFHWNRKRLAERLPSVRHQQGRLLGHMEALGFKLQQEAVLQTLTDDALKSSEIEGEKLDAGQVRSSIALRLGIDIAGLKPADRNVDGIVEMLLDATRHYDQPLTAERLFAWHASLFPSGRSGMIRIRTGAWRDDGNGPMQVVSGSIGREHVHFEAPSAARLDQELRPFLNWFNADAGTDAVLKAGLAHLWFVTLHPFEDGNGRIARAIADMALARADGTKDRFYSMSSQIAEERKEYYRELEIAQRGDLDITGWQAWFLDCLSRAIDGADELLAAVLHKAKLWQHINRKPVNERQQLVINRLLDDFKGFLTTSKYAKLAKCSPDTALRDIRELLSRGILVQNPSGGRSTSYRLAEPENITA